MRCQFGSHRLSISPRCPEEATLVLPATGLLMCEEHGSPHPDAMTPAEYTRQNMEKLRNMQLRDVMWCLSTTG